MSQRLANCNRWYYPGVLSAVGDAGGGRNQPVEGEKCGSGMHGGLTQPREPLESFVVD